MAKFFKMLCFVTSFVFMFSIFTSCIFGDSDLPKEPKEPFSDIERNTVLPMANDLVILEQSFTPYDSVNGYVPCVLIKVTITGQGTYFAYFNAQVTITWTYNEISEHNQGGALATYSATVGLDPDGNAAYQNTVALQGCRSVALVDVSYSWIGTATKK